MLFSFPILIGMPAPLVVLHGANVQAIAQAFVDGGGVVLHPAPTGHQSTFAQLQSKGCDLATRGAKVLLLADSASRLAYETEPTPATALHVLAYEPVDMLLQSAQPQDVQEVLHWVSSTYRGTVRRTAQSLGRLSRGQLWNALASKYPNDTRCCWGAGVRHAEKRRLIPESLLVGLDLQKHSAVYLEPRRRYHHVGPARSPKRFLKLLGSVLASATASVVAPPMPASVPPAVGPQGRTSAPGVLSLTQDPAYSIDPETHQFVDQDHRQVFFHGLNVVCKGPPYIPAIDHFEPQVSFVKEDAEMLRSLGLNAIRLGVMWPGVEPAKDQFDAKYLSDVGHIVRLAAEHGIHTILEMHQDLLSEKFCGEGAPSWIGFENKSFPTPINFPFPKDRDGVPAAQDCESLPWPSYHETLDCGRAFQNLYENVNGARDAWAKYWQKVANLGRGMGAAVLGYELINEPWVGDTIRDPTLLLPCSASNRLLTPAYEALAKAIRQVDEDHCVFFAAPTLDQGCTSFSEVPGGAAWRHKSVFAYHFYQPPWPSHEACAQYVTENLRNLRCGAMLTEFQTGSSDETAALPDAQMHTKMRTTMDFADKYLQSWIGWEYKDFGHRKTGTGRAVWDAQGNLLTGTCRTLARTYAQTVAGVARAMQFDAHTGAFMLRYDVSAKTSATDSRIFVSQQYHYPKGYMVDCQPQGVTWHSPSPGHVVVDHQGLAIGTSVTVRIAGA